MKNIFVGNLSFGTTEDSIRALFEQYGTVERVNLITDRDTGQARGFGFVEMSTDAEAADAVARLHGVEYDGRAMTVTEARSQEAGGGDRGGPRGPRPGGGGGGRR